MAEKKNDDQGRVDASADHDRIVMASRKPDGSPDQHDPEFIGPKDVAENAAKEQLAQQKVSAVDQAHRGVSDTGASGEGSTDPDPTVSKLVKAHEKAEKEAEAQAKSEVKSLHEGLGD